VITFRLVGGNLLASSAKDVVRRDRTTVEGRGDSPRVIRCFELDSKIDVTEGEEGIWDGEGTSVSGSATPRERKISEDVVSTASCAEAEAVSKVVEWYETTGMAVYSFHEEGGTE
jgi:hypothetical protein